MKKTLVALAALAVVGAASAQSTVTLYGRIDAGLASNSTKVNGVKTAGGNVGLQVVSAGVTGSRWGLRGSEDLGGGLKANFQLEQGFSVDTGNESDATKQFRRQAWVGLSGGFGNIQAGRQYGTIDNLMGTYDAQEYSTNSAMGYVFLGNLFSTTALIPAGVTCDGGAGVQQNITNNNCAGRINNSLIYTTPSMMGGLTAQVMWAPGENKNPVTGQSAGRYQGLFVNYGAGPLGLGFAYEKSKLTFAAPLPSTSQTLWMFGGSYDLGMAKLYGIYEKGNARGSAEDTGFSLGVVVPLGAMTMNAGYAREKTDAGAGVSGRNSAFAASLHYPLSKRTRLYSSFLQGKLKNAAGTSQQKDSSLNFGLIHNF